MRELDPEYDPPACNTCGSCNLYRNGEGRVCCSDCLWNCSECGRGLDDCKRPYDECAHCVECGKTM